MAKKKHRPARARAGKKTSAARFVTVVNPGPRRAKRRARKNPAHTPKRHTRSRHRARRHNPAGEMISTLIGIGLGLGVGLAVDVGSVALAERVDGYKPVYGTVAKVIGAGVAAALLRNHPGPATGVVLGMVLPDAARTADAMLAPSLAAPRPPARLPMNPKQIGGDPTALAQATTNNQINALRFLNAIKRVG